GRGCRIGLAEPWRPRRASEIGGWAPNPGLQLSTGGGRGGSPGGGLSGRGPASRDHRRAGARGLRAKRRCPLCFPDPGGRGLARGSPGATRSGEALAADMNAAYPPAETLAGCALRSLITFAILAESRSTPCTIEDESE